LAVEGAQLAASAIDARSKIENERLKNLLLTTFSYELKVPLKSLSQTASEILDPENIDNKSKRVELAEKMRREADLLNTLVDELSKIIETESKIV
ncbi:MAG: hypothetical protein PHX78_12125, partial [bacterium]|nr:hypothetical protein [bacterium]